MDDDDHHAIFEQLGELLGMIYGPAFKVFLRSEGWTSSSSKYSRPSKDPNRRECITITGMTTPFQQPIQENPSLLALWWISRKNGEMSLSEIETFENAKAESTLLHTFVASYMSTTVARLRKKRE